MVPMSFIRRILQDLTDLASSTNPEATGLLVYRDRLADLWKWEEQIKRAALQTWGFEAQRLMAMEELAEAIVALAKLGRAHGPEEHEDRKEKIAEEFADAGLMMDQMVLALNISGQVERWRAQKLERTAARLRKAGVVFAGEYDDEAGRTGEPRLGVEPNGG